MKITIESPYGTAEFLVEETIGVCGEEEEACFSFVGKMTAQAMELGRMFKRPVSFTVTATSSAQEAIDKLAAGTLDLSPPCDCWKGKNQWSLEERYGMHPCEHERLAPDGSPVRTAGACRCGAKGPIWDHRDNCAYPDREHFKPEQPKL